MSQESSRRAPARRRESFQPKDLGWLDLCEKHKDEGSGKAGLAPDTPAINIYAACYGTPRRNLGLRWILS
ncbi:hypothetical protein AGR1C_Lc80150 [Agrobacterium fabacearum TT111]|nr:hypothetical protein AGR1C_Lc80150 [Agrobacterium fabacearum TT111]